MDRELIIDGSTGEGGGQIVRTSLALSALLNRPVEIINIRRGRKNPGLQPQHLTAVRAMATIARARVEGAELGSQRLHFAPQGIAAGRYTFDVAAVRASAGSVGLIFQAVAPALFAASEPSRLTLKGGTHVPWSPPTTYLESVFLPALERLGLHGTMNTLRWGWYPRGGGVVEATIAPGRPIAPLHLEDRGELVSLECLSVVSNLPRSIAHRQRDRLLQRLAEKGLSAGSEILDAPSPGKGTFVFLLAHYESMRAGFGALGERGKPAERVADEAFAAFWAHHMSGAAVERHLADQVVVYLALAEGPSRFTTSEVTRHLLTNLWVVEQFLPVTFTVEGELGQPGVVEVHI